MEEYINEDLLDQAGMTHFNSAMGGTLTGLGILGTFLGLSMGLGSFNGNDIYTISDNVGPLLSGMKVAFHTSVYGIFFSLVFNFVYRSLMADAYGKLDGFLAAFRQCVLPQPVSERENSASMLVYQAGMADSMKKIMELLKGNAEEQTRGVERIVAQVMETLEYSMGASFASLGDTMRSAGRGPDGLCRIRQTADGGSREASGFQPCPPGLGGSGDGAPGGLCQRAAGAEGGPGSSLAGDD